MEAVALPCSPDQTIPPSKQIRRRQIRPSESFSPANLLLMNLQGGDFLLGPQPYLSSSLSFSLSNRQQQPLPPLLPLPINNKPCSGNRGLSCPPTNRKTNRNKDQERTPKKPKRSSGSTPKKQDSRLVSKNCLVITSTDRLGPEPSDLPEEVLMSVMKPSVASEYNKEEEEKFSGSVFYLSPPPSSLPLPKFSLRPKLSCNAEAGGIDSGATDDLRRLLRLL